MQFGSKPNTLSSHMTQAKLKRQEHALNRLEKQENKNNITVSYKLLSTKASRNQTS